MIRKSLVLIACLVCLKLTGQTKRYYLGVAYGRGSQQEFPFNSNNYKYRAEFFKLQVFRTLKEGEKWGLEAVAEPSYYRVDYQVLNKFSIRPDQGDNYLELRELYTQPRVINEYVLNLGLLVKRKLSPRLAAYLLVSSGPMYMNLATERQAKGFAFSDIAALGLRHGFGSFRLDTRFSIRHVSNAALKSPNLGHNSANVELGISF